jgi:type IV pilus assembly protein PilB
MRQDPDIILVGETGDKETAKIAVEAALKATLFLQRFMPMMRRAHS